MQSKAESEDVQRWKDMKMSRKVCFFGSLECSFSVHR